MFYKITCRNNQELHKKIRDVLAKAKEKGIEDQKILDSIPYKMTGKVLGKNSWSFFSINRKCTAIEFEEGQDIDPKVWIKKKDGLHYPNRKTRQGKEMSYKLSGMGDLFRDEITTLLFGDMSGRGVHTGPVIWIGDDCLVCFIFESDIKFLNVQLEEITMADASFLTGVNFEF